MNAENFHFEGKFDVIFAGEIIEHLSNPGLFLEKANKHLIKGGLLILTTPNAFSLRRLFEMIIFLTNNPGVNNQHTFWFSPKVISELIKRYKFNIIKIQFVDEPHIKNSFKSKTLSILSNILGGKMKETMIVFSQKQQSLNIQP